MEKTVDKIALEVVKHTEILKAVLTHDEFNRKMDRVLEGGDKMMVILTRLDQERIFTVERIRRVEEEIDKIKAHLALT